MPEEQQHPQHIPTSALDLIKLYMQQFGSLTFGTVTLIIVWITMVRPQLEINQATLNSQREILESLHDLADSLNSSVTHMKSTVEMHDRQIARGQQ